MPLRRERVLQNEGVKYAGSEVQEGMAEAHLREFSLFFGFFYCRVRFFPYLCTCLCAWARSSRAARHSMMQGSCKRRTVK